MSLINLAPRLTETITVKRITSHTAAGDAVYGSAFTMAARIERDDLETADAEGRRANSATLLFTLEELRLGDLVWLPETDTADVNEARRPGSVSPQRALDGSVTHYETELS